jgi:RHS repeat-associated protein
LVADASSDPVTGWSYLYDPAGRLQTATPSSGSAITYGYDGAGNRTSVKVGAATAVLTTFDGASRPLKSDNGTPAVTTDDTAYTHDKVGNLLTAGSTSYVYDTWNRMTKATVGSNIVLYTYDGLDRTVTRKLNSATATVNYYRGDTQQVVSTNGTLIAYGGSDTPLAQSVAGTVSDYEQNLHGDLSLTVTTAGAANGTHTYDPYGKTITTTGTGTTASVGYQSDPTDPTTSLIDMGTRNYDPNQGRFTGRDTEFGGWDNPNTINQYAYAADSPLQYTDPTGMYIDCGESCTATERHQAIAYSGEAIRGLYYANIPAARPSPPPLVVRFIVRAMHVMERGGRGLWDFARPKNGFDLARYGIPSLQGLSGGMGYLGKSYQAMGAWLVVAGENKAAWGAFARGAAMLRTSSALTWGGRLGKAAPWLGGALVFGSDRLQGRSMSVSVGGGIGSAVGAAGGFAIGTAACGGVVLCGVAGGAIGGTAGRVVGEWAGPRVASVGGSVVDVGSGAVDEIGGTVDAIGSLF